MENKFHPKRIVFVVIFMLITCFVFWGSERYEKLLFSVERSKADGVITGQIGKITGEEEFFVSENDSVTQQVIGTTKNWIYANRHGMTFGIIFGGLFLTLLSLLKPRFNNLISKGGRVGSLSGMLMGMPLGVCTNCATPIGVGLKKGGASLSSTLSLITSSPTLNPLLIISSFVLFSVPVALGKILGVLVLIFVAYPFIEKVYLQKRFKDKKVHFKDSENEDVLVPSAPAQENLFSSLFNSIYLSIKNILFVFIITAPLMILAALLAASLITYFDLESLAIFGSQINPILYILLAGLIGTFLPLPIYTDIIFVYFLSLLGVPEYILLTLFITMPSTSIFVSLVLSKIFSFKVALLKFISVYIVGILFGMILFLCT